MAFYRKQGGGSVAPTTVKRRSGAGWANVQTIRRRSGGAWVTVWTAYTPISNVVANPASIDAATVGLGASGTPFAPLPSVTWSGSTSATVTWSVVANPTDITINGTRVQAAHTVANGSYVSGTIRATVSDGTSSAYKDVPVILRYSTSA